MLGATSWGRRALRHYRTPLMMVVGVFFVLFFFSMNRSRTGPSQLLSLSASSESGLHTQRMDLEEDILVSDPTRLMIPNLNQEQLEEIDRVIVIPGGGSSSDIGGYPQWTKQRTAAAIDFYHALSNHERQKTVFLALSAGSFNAPNLLFEDKRTMFECQHTIAHLQRMGIDKERIFGDIFSWDTVTNGMTLRMFLEGLQVFRRLRVEKTTRMRVEVFISDFHAARAQAAFEWILSLEPSMLSATDVALTVHSVSSRDVHWPSAEDFHKRVEHEQQGLQMLRKQAQFVRTWPQFQSFLMLGGHLGIRKYLHNDFVKSVGAGWHF